MTSIAFAVVLACGLVADDLPKAVARLLKQKETHFPYFAEYKMTTPPGTDVAGRSVTHRFYAPSRSSLYSEERTDTYASRVLIDNGRAYWEYEDTGTGARLFQGPADVQKGTAHAFLERQGLPCNLFTSVDDSIRDRVKKWARTGVVRTRGDKTVIEGTGLGTIEISLTANRLTVTVVGAKNHTIIDYVYQEDKTPAWGEEGIARLRKRFKDADPKTITSVASSDKFNYVDLMQTVADEEAVRSIPVAGLRAVAKEKGYYLPKTAEIVSAEGVTAKGGLGYLCLTIRHGKKQYTILETIPGVTRESLPKGFVKDQRKVGNFEVLRIYDTGARSYSTYYIGDKVTFILTGDFYKDEVLEEVVRDFELAKK
jgi:hypothetical protein